MKRYYVITPKAPEVCRDNLDTTTEAPCPPPDPWDEPQISAAYAPGAWVEFHAIEEGAA